MHVETGPNGEQIRKHAGQKRTYKAISETYAFLPREAVTRFLMSCSECQKRMHLNPDGADHKDNGKPPTLVTSMIDYNMPITMAYMKHMKLQLLNSQQDEDESSIESDEFDMSDSTRMSAVNSDLSSNLEERMQSPQNLQGQQDDDSAAESFNGNETVGHSSNASGGTHCREMAETNSNGKTNLEQDEQPLNLSDSPLSAQLTSEYRLDDHSSNGKNKYKTLLISDLKMEREARENGSKSPAHSYSSYDSGKNESVGRGAEDLSLNRGDEDEDDHDEQEDPEKVNESDGVEAERLKAFNMFVRLFVDENLDRMVPISKQPKEKIQAIIDSCRRQFPEYQERARKRIRTYLKSCRRMKRSGFEMSRPIPSHLTSAVAESILASACESESRNAAKRMRLDRQQDEAAPADKQYKQEPAQVTYSTSAVSSTQEVLYINGNGTYSYHSYRGLGGGLLNLNDASSSDLQPTSTTATTQHCIPGTTNVQSPSSSGPTDLSMKRQLATSSGSSSSSSSRPQLSPTEINAVRQLVAGYRESAAFLLRSADELENLILQQN
ncbi:nucleolar protein 4 isoform X4 [Falco biarmicus]|nr:PREDICTED: nucleolar protein 4 isoform X3 [Calidris pugnax]XP_026698176.1 nucleolar protein 4 isoform X1 [Athene cunicularia]XP_027648264.1 nucleolar protein 4 isoform X4 [Falco peregrinus]XP_032856992.1 nucleolar protein 4 isoform X4 [Tyto alba]XP_037237196.1 nucleolar protein 4 isoform X4 [Falco rusticolus]XP_040443887.1 nucleolar protein 4 isoform X4 [Falco naumanni]XP_055561968.1 nucleolar protein 4 isoform X4 [Falco cherrug]XP_056189128.1 nucleolar protein 4 isoform X4 [Falco biarmic